MDYSKNIPCYNMAILLDYLLTLGYAQCQPFNLL